MAENPVRTKTKAAGQATGAAAAVAYALDLVGFDLGTVPAPVLIFAGGALATLAAFLKRDGLRGAWDRIVNGDPAE